MPKYWYSIKICQKNLNSLEINSSYFEQTIHIQHSKWNIFMCHASELLQQHISLLLSIDLITYFSWPTLHYVFEVFWCHDCWSKVRRILFFVIMQLLSSAVANEKLLMENLKNYDEWLQYRIISYIKNGKIKNLLTLGLLMLCTAYLLGMTKGRKVGEEWQKHGAFTRI